MENMVPFFPPPPQFAAAQLLPTAAPPPLTTQTPPPLQQPQVVIPPAPLGFMPPQTNLAELQHITPPQQVVIPPAPTPLKQSPSHNNHPPYAEMIITAIKALNEITGSSKIAIAKFIGATYTNLPPNHSALLSHHLKRLKDNGLIITIKNSYTLPSLINLNNPLSPPSASAPGAADSTTPKRGRGRPPKTNTTSTPGPSPSPNPDLSSETTIVGEVQGRSEEVVLPAKRGRGRPPGSIAKPKAISKPKPKPKPIVVGGGGGGSRGRGRPRKVTSDAFGSGPSGPPAQLAGLVPGMVILPATNENIVVNGGAAATTVVSTAPTVDVPTVDSTTPAAGSGRPVGRPKKVNVESSTVVPVANGVAVVKPVGSGRSVGRPKKVGAVGRPRKVVGSVGRPKRTVGRPAKFGGGGGVVKKTAAVSTGRPAGRPRKVGNNIKDRVVTLLEESLGLGMNQSVPDMYLRFTQLYNIITGKDYDIALAGATAQGNNQ